ncbi:uncharacterized protein LOC114946226 [Nylanderia fulva]|uniref:uncharacterized protein LOC114946226 n=1 Tax=Nylanderia fulva TaxID=613905 RepID=UPI0010FB3A2B|nr:uncharacterized protein LOC114946226 [Nylanderia fulva]
MEALILSQHELSQRVARTYDNLKKSGITKINKGLVATTLKLLGEKWAKIQDQHSLLRMEYWSEVKKNDYIVKDFMGQVEDIYTVQRASILASISKFTALTKLEEALSKKTLSAVSAEGEFWTAPRTTLPRIQLPQFSGRYKEWPSFRDLFHSIIGKDASVTPVEKLHYLKSCLKGETEMLVRSLPTTDENFDRAWKTLTDYYENRRLLVRSYISKFTALTKLKGESANDLRKLYHGVKNTVGSLESIGRPITTGEDLFVYLVVELLDSRSRREWESSICETTEPPPYAKLEQFWERRLHTLESLQPLKTEVSSSKTSTSDARQTRSLHVRKQESKRGRCSLCRKDHYIMLCDVYRGQPANERKQHIVENDMCLNCLGKHKVSECSSQKTCSVCRERHHTSLHDACKPSVVATTSHLAYQPSKAPVAAILATARVRVADRHGVMHTARALIDQGSESSLVAESLAQRLRLPRSSASVAIYGIGDKQTSLSRGQITLKLTSLKGDSAMTVNALVLSRLTSYDDAARADWKGWPHIRDLELADPNFLDSDPIEILLGVGIHTVILQEGIRKGGPQEPMAQQTSLGWILSGVTGTTVDRNRATTYLCYLEDDLPTLVGRFWHQEELPSATSSLAPEELECEEFFKRTHTRTAEGRYIVRLPVIPPLPDFSPTRRAALHALTGMERRFSRNTRLKDLYKEFMGTYEELGHMTLLDGPAGGGERVSYLPHHGVMRESSSTTKLQVVFNGSTTTPAGESLNRHLMVGPNLLPPLADILLRWRRHAYVLASDVEKMYRQILVHPDDRDLQRIL